MSKPATCLATLMAAAFCAQSAEAAPQEKEATQDAAPEGFVEMFVAGVLPTEGGPAAVLRDKSEKTLLPIFIGMSEAHSIQLRLDRRRFPRPLTHDLLDAIVHELGGEVLKIHVDDVKGDTFMGTVFVKTGDKVARFDARPSDSIALAVGNSAPIFVSRGVIDRMSAKGLDAKEMSPAASNEDASDFSDETPPVSKQAIPAVPSSVTTL